MVAETLGKTMINLNDLEAKAKAVPIDPDASYAWYDGATNDLARALRVNSLTPYPDEEAAYIAAASPDVVLALIEALRAADAVVYALGNHYCGACGNGGVDGDDRPYDFVSDPEIETCSGCRPAYDACIAAAEALVKLDAMVGGKE